MIPSQHEGKGLELKMEACSRRKCYIQDLFYLDSGSYPKGKDLPSPLIYHNPVGTRSPVACGHTLSKDNEEIVQRISFILISFAV